MNRHLGKHCVFMTVTQDLKPQNSDSHIFFFLSNRPNDETKHKKTLQDEMWLGGDRQNKLDTVDHFSTLSPFPITFFLLWVFFLPVTRPFVYWSTWYGIVKLEINKWLLYLSVKTGTSLVWGDDTVPGVLSIFPAVIDWYYHRFLSHYHHGEISLRIYLFVSENTNQCLEEVFFSQFREQVWEMLGRLSSFFLATFNCSPK